MINKEMITTFNKLKYFFLIIAFGITLLFIIVDLNSGKIVRQTFIDIGVLIAIVLYIYGDKTNKILPLIMGLIIIIISMIFDWPF